MYSLPLPISSDFEPRFLVAEDKSMAPPSSQLLVSNLNGMQTYSYFFRWRPKVNATVTKAATFTMIFTMISKPWEFSPFVLPCLMPTCTSVTHLHITCLNTEVHLTLLMFAALYIINMKYWLIDSVLVQSPTFCGISSSWTFPQNVTVLFI